MFTRNHVGAWAHEAYVKPSTTDPNDQFGYSVALSGDSDTLAVGARYEASNATGIGGNQADDTMAASGAVFVFVRNPAWSQEAYVKASNTAGSDWFGTSVALNDDGNALAVGANGEDSNATGVGGDQLNDFAGQAGAAYV